MCYLTPAFQVFHAVASRTLDGSIASILRVLPLIEGQRLVLGTVSLSGTVPSGRQESSIGALRVIGQCVCLESTTM